MTQPHGADTQSSPPDALPVLARGAHRHPGQGACLMEYTAVLAGRRFNDHPTCTHPALAELARQVNDRASGGARSLLITRAPTIASIGPERAGVSAGVASAVLLAQRQYAPTSLLLPWRTSQQTRLRRRDVAGQGWWSHKRDLLITYDLIRGGLSRLERSTPDAEVRDRLLLGVLDRALFHCARLRGSLQLRDRPGRRSPVAVAAPPWRGTPTSCTTR